MIVLSIHIDENRSNNCVDNLEYITQSANVKHSFTGLGRERSLHSDEIKVKAKNLKKIWKIVEVYI